MKEDKIYSDKDYSKSATSLKCERLSTPEISNEKKLDKIKS